MRMSERVHSGAGSFPSSLLNKKKTNKNYMKICQVTHMNALSMARIYLIKETGAYKEQSYHQSFNYRVRRKRRVLKSAVTPLLLNNS